MKIRATKTDYLEVEVREDDILEKMESIIRTKCGLKANYWVTPEGKLLETMEAYHGSDWDEDRGTATDLQKLGYETIKNMHNIHYGRVK